MAYIVFLMGECPPGKFLYPFLKFILNHFKIFSRFFKSKLYFSMEPIKIVFLISIYESIDKQKIFCLVYVPLLIACWHCILDFMIQMQIPHVLKKLSLEILTVYLFLHFINKVFVICWVRTFHVNLQWQKVVFVGLN